MEHIVLMQDSIHYFLSLYRIIFFEEIYSAKEMLIHPTGIIINLVVLIHWLLFSNIF